MRGWLLDLYADERDGLVLWLLGEDGQRHRLHHDFPVCFYVAGPFPRLRQLWRFLETYSQPLTLRRSRREDLFAGWLDVLAIELPNPSALPQLFATLQNHFPDLDYYNADIPLSLRYSAAHGVFPLAFCQVEAEKNGRLSRLTSLDTPWDLNPTPLPLRILTIQPNTDPQHQPPTHLTISTSPNFPIPNSQSPTHHSSLPLHPPHHLLIRLNAAIRRHDPDLLLTRWGDTWLFPYLFDLCQQHSYTFFNPNRDEQQKAHRRQANSYHTYGHVVYRGPQTHLRGRWHIDQRNAMMFNEYKLLGIFEQARVTGLPVQEIARKSPGSGVTAMQMQTALQRGILIPVKKQQAERFKSARDLLRSDRGGLVYQPTIGLHHNVAEIDFVSMYPATMVHFNISPETCQPRPLAIEKAQALNNHHSPTVSNGMTTSEMTATTAAPATTAATTAVSVPELPNLLIDTDREGLIPQTLRPLLTKRIALKQQLAQLNERDCRYAPLKARSTALKWLLVVCFGYLGYKNARFGRIEAHEAVTAYGREALLRAKEAAEDLGFTVLHMYVDGLWVQRDGLHDSTAVQPLLDEITRRTSLPIALEGIYRWVAFLPSRLDPRVPVANRYFGHFQNGKIKTRGIAARRRDACPFIRSVQLELLQRLAKLSHPTNNLPTLIPFLRQQYNLLQNGRLPLDQLLITQTLSRELNTYRVLSPAAQAAQQLAASGKPRCPGQPIRFLYTRGHPSVHAWDLPYPLPAAAIDTPRYTTLLLRALTEILIPFGLDEPVLHAWLRGDALQLPLPKAKENSLTCNQGKSSPVSLSTTAAFYAAMPCSTTSR